MLFSTDRPLVGLGLPRRLREMALRIKRDADGASRHGGGVGCAGEDCYKLSSIHNFTFERTELEDSHVTRTARLNAQVTAAQLNENMHQVGPCTARWFLDPSPLALPFPSAFVEHSTHATRHKLILSSLGPAAHHGDSSFHLACAPPPVYACTQSTLAVQ